MIFNEADIPREWVSGVRAGLSSHMRYGDNPYTASGPTASAALWSHGFLRGRDMGQEMKTIWQLDFDEARRLKRKVEGEPPVDGLDCGEPSTRLYLQMLEAANDLDQIERDGKPVPAFLRQAFRSAALWARSIAQDDRPRPWEER